MISRPTVLILGAGASVDYGFPTGRRLLRHIISDLASSGWQKGIISELGFEDADIEAFRSELIGSGQPSVDAFLESREEWLSLGKAAIAARLVPEEKEAEVTGRNEKMRWYEYLREQLGTTEEDVAENHLSIITYNYDRSIEFYLFTAFKNSYGMSDGDALQLLSTIPIVHVHGQLAKLDVDGSTDGRRYLPHQDINAIKKAIAGIKVLHETTISSPELEEARALISNASLICIIGFGYLATNLKRLRIAEVASSFKDTGGMIYGSAFGLGDARKRMIQSAFFDRIMFGGRNQGALDFLQDYVVFE